MKIIVAVDESPYSKKIVDTVVRRDWPMDTQFKVLTVVEPPCDQAENDESDCYIGEIGSQVVEHQHNDARKLCEQIRYRIESTVPMSQVHYEIRDGRAASEIIDAAVEWSADRIIIGAHGYNACPHNLSGSVSRSVAHNVASHALCTVEVIRDKRAKKEPATAVSSSDRRSN